jgi:hypothetical protein
MGRLAKVPESFHSIRVLAAAAAGKDMRREWFPRPVDRLIIFVHARDAAVRGNVDSAEVRFVVTGWVYSAEGFAYDGGGSFFNDAWYNLETNKATRLHCSKLNYLA